MRSRKRILGQRIVISGGLLLFLGGGIFFAIMVLRASGPSPKAAILSCKQSIGAVDTALSFFYTKNGRYVTNKEGLFVLIEKKLIKKGQVTDPWGNLLDYKSVNNGKNYYLRSIGPDGKKDTKDDINSNNHPWPEIR